MLALLGCVLLLAMSVFPGLVRLLPYLEPTALAAAVGLVVVAWAVLLGGLGVAALGDDWRMGIDEDEPPELRTRGVFGLVRHPIYSAVMLWLIGLVLINPSSLILGMAVIGSLLCIAQARREERHLLQTFGGRYAMYQKSVGRFVPRPLELWWRSKIGRDA